MHRMARALRFEFPYARYHVTARGNERKAIFRGDPERFHFLELLGEATERRRQRAPGDLLVHAKTHRAGQAPRPPTLTSRLISWLTVDCVRLSRSAAR